MVAKKYLPIADRNNISVTVLFSKISFRVLAFGLTGNNTGYRQDLYCLILPEVAVEELEYMTKQQVVLQRSEKYVKSLKSRAEKGDQKAAFLLVKQQDRISEYDGWLFSTWDSRTLYQGHSP